MEELMKKLWSGSLSPIRNVSDNKNVFELYSSYKRCKEILYDALDDEKKRLFEEAERLESEYSATKEFEIFKEGFRLGKSLAKL